MIDVVRLIHKDVVLPASRAQHSKIINELDTDVRHGIDNCT